MKYEKAGSAMLNPPFGGTVAISCIFKGKCNWERAFSTVANSFKRL